MRLSRTTLPSGVLLLAALAGCAGDANTNNAANVSASPAASPSPAAQALTETQRPQRIQEQAAQRGEQESAAPVLRIVEPADGSTVSGSTVRVRLNLSGDLKGYQPHKDPATQAGNHIHVILDNQPYEAYYNLAQPFELRNVAAGRHTLRVFASRPWHESYKNEGSFQMVAFEVRGGGDPSQPTTTNSGQRMADPANANSANANANAATTPEGKEMAASTGGEVDRSKPLLTYSRPKGEYKGPDADAIMIDFWLTGAKLQGDGGEYRVRYAVDGGAPRFIDRWQPLWLAGWTAGKHTVRLELVDKAGNPVDNGGYNTTSRDITVVR
ncbi:MAG: hypothetical protein M3416_19415 [Acidobacteriota bacterium]|nr:hypothetical protein [Acidobacteriota bacterium]